MLYKRINFDTISDVVKRAKRRSDEKQTDKNSCFNSLKYFVKQSENFNIKVSDLYNVFKKYIDGTESNILYHRNVEKDDKNNEVIIAI